MRPIQWDNQRTQQCLLENQSQFPQRELGSWRLERYNTCVMEWSHTYLDRVVGQSARLPRKCYLNPSSAMPFESMWLITKTASKGKSHGVKTPWKEHRLPLKTDGARRHLTIQSNTEFKSYGSGIFKQCFGITTDWLSKTGGKTPAHCCIERTKRKEMQKTDKPYTFCYNIKITNDSNNLRRKSCKSLSR